MTTTQKEHDNDEYLSDHTKSMRRALNHCIAVLGAEAESRCSKTTTTCSSPEMARDALHASQHMVQLRQESLEAFMAQPDIYILNSDDTMTPQQFRQDFHRKNMPCLLKGGPAVCFRRIQQEWTTANNDNIRIEWFQNHVGNETMVPVSHQTTTTTANSSSLDPDGRAQECIVVPTRLQEWIDQHRFDSTKYLKDWHLVQFLNASKNQQSLYTVPPFFQRDLLNTFSTAFCGDADYQFVYWGSAGSKTSIHSDVLHSFSWSYNVIGEKKWTLHLPNNKILVLYQKAGEIFFVPSTWKHEVENVVETLSINHNWITTANMDATWACIDTERLAVQREMNLWGLVGHHVEESMLFGCIGMDVTMFFLMCITSLLEPLQQQNKNWEDYFDIFRLGSMIENLLTTNGLDLQSLLASVFVSETLAEQAIDIAQRLLNQICRIKETLL